MSKVYYRCTSRAGSAAGATEPIPAVTSADPYRREFRQRFRTDADFRTNKVGFPADGNVEEFLRKYEEFVRPGVKNVPPVGADCETCVALFKVGLSLGPADAPTRSNGGKHFRVETENGVCKTLPEDVLRPWDATHEHDIPDDVTRISAFSEASLLLAVRRRFENLQIYTYVGDIVISVNPYMLLPAEVHISNPPQQYGLGRTPNAYATAFFAYWGQLRAGGAGTLPRTPDAGNAPVRQACIVSGESGAGKTYCCGRVMKFLNALSKQRESTVGPSAIKQQAQATVGATAAGGTGVQRGSISDLVEDVSPFLEAFGNAKTKRNDNSSRFGKFMEILFDDGRIVGARIKHYLLEKSRAVTQGRGERSFHIFYQMLKGLSPQERTQLSLQPDGNCEHYKSIMRGDTHVVDPDDPGADAAKFNDPYVPGDPDNSGVRACLANANCPPKHMDGVWRVLAAALKLGNVKFRDSDGVAQSGSGSCPNGPNDLHELSEVAELLQLEPRGEAAVDGTAGRYLGDMLCINRRIIQGKQLDSDVRAVQAAQNRDALVKHLYARLFEFVVGCANDMLGAGLPPSLFNDMQTTVGILDIFGFEVFQRNSLEQLFINFANEKLQNEFNKYIFEKELELYRSEGLLEQNNFDFTYQNNTECCNLIEARRRRPLFIGILPLLEDLGQSLESTDAGFCRQLIKLFGRGSSSVHGKGGDGSTDGGGGDGDNEEGGVKPKAPGDYFFARRGGGNVWFGIHHFAGEVTYHVEGFIQKNQDRVPVQLTQLLAEDTMEGAFIRDQLCDAQAASPSKGGRKGGGGKSISSKFVGAMADLCKRLRVTTPHYIRCVKPNDFKLRPIDGRVAFDAFKVYEQLLYAGVMEVVRVKKEGYPFRMSYEDFWRDRVVRDGVAKLMQLDVALSPRDGADAVCRRIVEDLAIQARNRGDNGHSSHGTSKQTWILGNTMLFGKHTLPAGLRRWTQTRVSNTACRFVRFQGSMVAQLLLVQTAVATLGTAWRRQFAARKYQLAQSAVRTAQSLARACLERVRVKHMLAVSRAAQMAQAAVRHRLIVCSWCRLVVAVAEHEKHLAARSIQVLVRAACAAAGFQRERELRRARQRGATLVQLLARAVVAKQEWSTNRAYVERLRLLRRMMAGRVAHARLLMRVVRARHQKRLDQARAFLASGLLTLARRGHFTTLRRAAILCQRRVRRAMFARLLVRRRSARKRVQAFGRLILVLSKLWSGKVASTRIQTHWRAFVIRRWFRQFLRVFKNVQLKFLRTHFRKALGRWLLQAEAAIYADDAAKVGLLVECAPEEFACLRGCANLINVRDRIRGTTCLHAAARARNLRLVQYLVRNGADPLAVDAAGNTPLHTACEAGDGALGVVDYLITTSPRPLTFTRNTAGHAPLAIALAAAQAGAGARLVVRTLRLQMELDAQWADVDAAAVAEAHRASLPVTAVVAAREASSEHGVARSRSRAGGRGRVAGQGLHGDELVLAQLLVLGQAGTVDPVTHQTRLRQRHAAAAVVQCFLRRRAARLLCRERAAERVRQAKAAVPRGNINPAATARIKALRERREERQRRLASRETFFVAPATVPHQRRRKQTDSRHPIPDSPGAAAATREEASEPKKSEQAGPNTLVPLRVVQDFVVLRQAKHDRHARHRHPVVHGDVVAAAGHSALGVAAAPKESAVVGSASELAPRVNSTNVLVDQTLPFQGGQLLAKAAGPRSARAAADDAAASPDMKPVPAAGDTVASLRLNMASCLLEYWRVMGVRKSSEPLYWFRVDELGEVNGPATLGELKRSVQRSPGAAGGIECRHAGMPAFVPLKFLADSERSGAAGSPMVTREVLLSARQALARWLGLNGRKP